MEDKINNLLRKCIENGLQFEFSALNYDTIEVWNEFGKPSKLIGRAFISNWTHTTPDDELDRLHRSVDEYIGGKEND